MDSIFSTKNDTLNKYDDSKLTNLLTTIDPDFYTLQKDEVTNHIYSIINKQFYILNNNRMEIHFWLRMLSKLIFFKEPKA